MPFFRRFSVLFLILTIVLLVGCTSQPASSQGNRETRHTFPVPEASGQIVHALKNVTIDASHTEHGYVMLRYQGNASRARLQITAPSGIVYSYPLHSGFETFPLTEGDGRYLLKVLEHAYDNMYSVLATDSIDAVIADPFDPFLYPNQYVWFTEDSQGVKLGQELSDDSSSDLDYIRLVYRYITRHIKYDHEAAKTATAEYLPDIDRTLDSGKGICFDYASLMAAMLRSQGIPTKLVTGYSGTTFHAWISVYLTEIGWVDKIISFDGQNWTLMDPTLAASNTPSTVKKYLREENHYLEKYVY